MKKLFLILLLSFLLVSNAWAVSGTFLDLISSGGATDYTQDANCQGAWLFADDLTDESGEGNTLTDGGTVSYTTDRPSGFSTGKSIDCDGSTDYIYIVTGDQSANFIPKAQAEDCAVCYWAYHDASVGFDYIVGGGSGLRLRLTADDKVSIYIKDNNLDNDERKTEVHALSQWQHNCMSFDGSATQVTVWSSTAAGSFGNIANGVTDIFTNVDNVKASTDNFAIGSNHSGSDYWFDGHIYQPIIFNRTILGTEAEEMYTYGIKGAD